MLKLGGFAKRFWHAREAVAAVEFALILPIMLALYLGSIELSSLINVDQRITTISGTVGDLVARSDGTLTGTSLTDYFTAASAILAPYPTTDLQMVVSCVAVDKDGNTDVIWSEGYNGAATRPTDKPFAAPNAIPQQMIDISENNYVIVAEASYPYKPLLGIFFKNTFNLYRETFYLPRYPGEITYDSSS